jgi:hypothetical protein
MAASVMLAENEKTFPRTDPEEGKVKRTLSR